MKILFLTHYFPPEGNAPASRVGALTRRWVEQGHDVTVVTGVPNVPDGVVYPGYKNRLLPQTEKTDEGVNLIRVWTWLAPNKGTARRILNFISYMVSAVFRCLFLSKPDVVIATSPQFFCGWAGVLLKWWYKLISPRGKSPKFVLEIRDIWPESIQAVGAMQSGMAIRVLEKMEHWMYASADHIVTVGSGYQQRLEEKDVSPDKISIVMNGVDREVLEAKLTSEELDSLRKEWGLEGKFVCSYIGTIGMASGLEVYLRAARLLKSRGIKDICLLAVGDGAIREELQAAVDKEGLSEFVVFTGRRPKHEMPLFLGISDVCFVHLIDTPLFRTVIPSKIFEALGMKKPILIGVQGEARRLVETSQGGVAMTPESEDELLASLLELKAKPDEMASLGAQGNKFVRENFTRDVLADNYIQIIKGV